MSVSFKVFICFMLMTFGITLLQQKHIKVLPVHTISKFLHFRIFRRNSLAFFDLLASFQFTISLFQPILNRSKHIVHRIIFNLVRYQVKFRRTDWNNYTNRKKKVKKVHFTTNDLFSRVIYEHKGSRRLKLPTETIFGILDRNPIKTSNKIVRYVD